MKSFRLNPVTIAVLAVFLLVAVYAVFRSLGYAAGSDTALTDNRSDAAHQSSQNVEG